jgi:hypothetical protein
MKEVETIEEENDDNIKKTSLPNIIRYYWDKIEPNVPISLEFPRKIASEYLKGLHVSFINKCLDEKISSFLDPVNQVPIWRGESR